MSQFARLSRNPGAAPATRSGRPAAGRPAASHATVVTTRLRKLAAAGSTGTLPFTGGCEGAIYFSDGIVVGAESARTPARRAEPVTAASLASALSLEPAVDAILDLVMSPSGCSRFRSARGQLGPGGLELPVDVLLAELTRRRRLLEQMSDVMTADTAVTRAAQIHAPRVQVSRLQWALLIRVRPGTTPRDLAFELSRSVFGTTAEVYRLIALRLLSAADHPGQAQASASPDALERGPAALSFSRAVSP